MSLEPQLPAISNVTMRFFARIVRGQFRRHFCTVMAQHASRLRRSRGALIVYANHSSWWDSMLLVLLARTLLPERRHYAPVEASALKRYPILRRLGLFPVELNTPRGAAQFLEMSQAVLQQGAVLWATPQGRLADTREFPLAFRPGLAALAARCPEVPLLPVAVEYTFWDERLPEALVRFGDPLHCDAGMSSERLTRHLECALTAEMLELQKASCARDAGAFEMVLSGRQTLRRVYSLRTRQRVALAKKHLVLDHERMRLL
jgi:1-acyl-sn-glycerol-3-phosphate acyltransferase